MTKLVLVSGRIEVERLEDAGELQGRAGDPILNILRIGLDFAQTNINIRLGEISQLELTLIR